MTINARWATITFVFSIVAMLLMGFAPRRALAQATETPIPTPTATPTASRTPLPTLPPLSTQTSQPGMSQSASSMGAAEDFFNVGGWITTIIEGALPMMTPIAGVDNTIATVSPMLTTTPIPTMSVVSSSNPVSVAQGLVISLADAPWLAILFTFFIGAFIGIAIVEIVHFVTSLSNILDRVMSIANFLINLIKLIPGL